VLFGAVIPMVAMTAIYGRETVQDAPAHSGAILLLTVPFAGICSVVALIFLAIVFTRSSLNRKLLMDLSSRHCQLEPLEGHCDLERWNLGSGSGRSHGPPDCEGSRTQEPVIARSQ
jgi:hypothetical protein